MDRELARGVCFVRPEADGADALAGAQRMGDAPELVIGAGDPGGDHDEMHASGDADLFHAAIGLAEGGVNGWRQHDEQGEDERPDGHRPKVRHRTRQRL